MSTSPDNELEFFQDLEELVIEQASSATQGTSKPEPTVVTSVQQQELKKRNSEPRDPSRDRRMSVARDSKQTPHRLSEDEVCDFLSEPSPGQQKLKAVASAEDDHQTRVSDSSLVSERHASPVAQVNSRLSYRTASHARITSPLKWLLAVIPVCLIATLVWLFLPQLAASAPPEFKGSIRFEGPPPAAAFIQLLKLNSPREEDYVVEIKDGRFTFPSVPSGDYALWLATADGTPIPVRPVGLSIGVLEEAEHHLRISLPDDRGELDIELSAR